MKRTFDLIMAIFLLLTLFFPILFIMIMIRLTSEGPVLYWSDRVGKNNKIFKMPKFRTMRMNTPVVATHLLENPDGYLAPAGSFLRKFSIDELPQLLSIITGNMSFVGPRPALFNQYDLIEIRTKKNIHKLIPGITGWAQVNGRDSLPIPVKVEFDEYYLKKMSLLFDIKILILTVLKVIRGEGIHH